MPKKKKISNLCRFYRQASVQSATRHHDPQVPPPPTPGALRLLPPTNALRCPSPPPGRRVQRAAIQHLRRNDPAAILGLCPCSGVDLEVRYRAGTASQQALPPALLYERLIFPLAMQVHLILEDSLYQVIEAGFPVHCYLPPLKSLARIALKVDTSPSHKGDFSHVTDVVRCSIVARDHQCDTLYQVKAFLDHQLQALAIHPDPQKSKDRLQQPPQKRPCLHVARLFHHRSKHRSLPRSR